MRVIDFLFHLVSPFNADLIVSKFERDLKRLTRVIENRRAAAEDHMTKADDLIREAKDHADHAARAERIAERLKELVS